MTYFQERWKPAREASVPASSGETSNSEPWSSNAPHGRSDANQDFIAQGAGNIAAARAALEAGLAVEPTHLILLATLAESFGRILAVVSGWAGDLG